MGCIRYAVLEIQLGRFHTPFCLTLKAIQLATRYWETKMHRFFNTCTYFFIQFPSFLQQKFLGEGCTACSGFSNTDLEYVKILYGMSARFICVVYFIPLLPHWSEPISWDLRWKWTVRLVGPWLSLLPSSPPILNHCLFSMFGARCSDC